MTALKIADEGDNCPLTFNPMQLNADEAADGGDAQPACYPKASVPDDWF